MVISIDTIRDGVEFEPVIRCTDWAVEPPVKEWESGPGPGRGILCGLILSCVLWAGLIIGIRALIALLT